MSFVRFLLVTSLVFAIANTAYGQLTCPSVGGNQCNLEGSCISYPNSDQYCACHSGFGGLDCASAADATCSFNSVSATTTSNIPIAVQAGFTNDELTVTVKSPLVTERIYSTIAVDASVANNPNCTYPGKYWSRQFDGCADQFQGVMPWALTNDNCGWVLDSSDLEYFTYNSDMTIQHHDLIDPFNGRTGQQPVERLTQHVVPLQVQFQKYIDVTSEITVQSPVRLLVAVTRQEVAADTQTAIIEVTTNLLYPYKLSAEDLASIPNATYPGMQFSISEVGDVALCPNVAGSACTQIFRISIVIGQGNCQITGAYGINWALNCQADPNNGNRVAACAIETGASSSADISILSEDFCAKVSVKVAISGTLSVYDSNAYTTPKTNFLQNQTSFFRADITSPDASLESATIQSVKLVSGQQQILLFSNGSISIAASNFALGSSGSDFADFNFVLHSSYINGIAVDSSKTYQVIARVDVTFSGVPGVKRLVLQGTLNNKPLSLNTKIGVLAPLETGTNQLLDQSSGDSLAPMLLLAGASSLAAFSL